MPENTVHLVFSRKTAVQDNITDFIILKQASGSACATLEDYQWTLNHFFSHYPQAWSGPSAMREAFLSWINKPIAPATYNQRLIYVRAFWRWCVEERIQPPEPDPFRGLKRRKDPGHFRDIDAAKVKELLTLPDRSTWAGLRDYALSLFTLDTAARPGEALQLLPEHFNIFSLAVTIPHKTAKTREERIVPFSPTTAAALRQLFRARPPEWGSDTPVFCNESGQRLSVDSWRQRPKNTA